MKQSRLQREQAYSRFIAKHLGNARTSPSGSRASVAVRPLAASKCAGRTTRARTLGPIWVPKNSCDVLSHLGPTWAPPCTPPLLGQKWDPRSPAPACRWAAVTAPGTHRRPARPAIPMRINGLAGGQCSRAHTASPHKPRSKRRVLLSQSCFGPRIRRTMARGTGSHIPQRLHLLWPAVIPAISIRGTSRPGAVVGLGVSA